MSIAATDTRASRLRSAIGWLRQMKAALEIAEPHANADPTARARELDHAVNRLRAFGIDPRI